MKVVGTSGVIGTVLLETHTLNRKNVDTRTSGELYSTEGGNV